MLVVGAGPSGLATALAVARYGLRVRVVDHKDGPVEQARATMVHARTLEYLDHFGLADHAMAQGTPITHVQVYDQNRGSAELPLAGRGIEGRTRFPCALSLPQSKFEATLVTALAEYGVSVDWNTRLEDVTDHGHNVGATVRRGAQREQVVARRLVGADGARSTVRRCLGIAFNGSTYPQIGLLADVALDARLPPNRLRLTLTRGGFVGVVPIGDGTYRLFGAVPPGFGPTPSWSETTHDPYAQLARDRLRKWWREYFQADGELRDVVWASLFRFHSCIADRFSTGNVFLVGDAAHIHNPAGGQGLNLGVGDATNLAWKLALVSSGEAKVSILRSYETERRRVARTIMHNTDRGFKLELGGNAAVMWIRMRLLRRLVRPLTRLPLVRKIVFRILSQTWISYRGSPAVAAGPATGSLRAGDRAPHTALATTSGSILDVLRQSGYQLLMFEGISPTASLGELGRIGAELPERYLSPVRVHVIPRAETAAHETYGAHHTRVVLVRPDGHIALIGEPRGPRDIEPLITHLDGILLTRPRVLT
ncbi:FAD-dependent monooxygenase [Pseudonocardia eucalypti]|uniref:FAD-dependent monooxygenase n=1 Tax=Pseudonocardia eucalypti TaxID=648755 RepID=A0ABP9QG04_9PSEU